MTSDLDIYRAAHATIARYGGGAALHAAHRADALLALGDMEGRASGIGSSARSTSCSGLRRMGVKGCIDAAAAGQRTDGEFLG